MNVVRARTIALAAAWLVGGAAGLAEPAAAPVTGFRADAIGNIDYAAKQLVSLAEAVPAEKYSWRPAPGVRSVSEVYMHVALANYYLLSLTGVKMPDGVDREMETKLTDKAKVVETLKKSIAHLRSSIEGIARRGPRCQGQVLRPRHVQARRPSRRPGPPPRAPRAVDRVCAVQRRDAPLERLGRGAGEEDGQVSGRTGRRRAGGPPRGRAAAASG